MRDRAILLAYVVALLLFGVIAGFGYSYLGRTQAQGAWIAHTHEVLQSAEGTLGDLRDLETGQHGYLLSGDPRFLEPYERSVVRIDERLDTLRRLTADNPVQQRRLDELEGAIAAKRAFMDETIARFRGGDPDGARALVATGRGRELMGQIRALMSSFVLTEREALTERTETADRLQWRATTLFLLGNLVAFTFLAAGTLLLGRELDRSRHLRRELARHAERQQLQDDLARAKDRLEAALEEMPVGVAIVEPDGLVHLDNARLRGLFGRVVSTERGGDGQLGLARGDGGPYAEGTDPASRALTEGRTTRGDDARIARPGGAAAELLVHVAPLRERDGRVSGAVVVVEDRAELLRLEEQQAASERFRDVFLRALGHDLRNPLTVITAGAASLARRAQSDEVARVVARMTSAAGRMDRMVRQLLELTSVRLGEGPALERQRADLGAIARRVVERREVENPAYTFTVETDGDLAGTWDVDALERALDELVVNAVEHGREGGPVSLTVRDLGERVVAEVHNVGNPIPEDLRALLFDPFRRAAERLRTRSQGLGVGLYLAEQIAVAHGGSLRAISEPDAGTTFRMELPRA